MQTSSLGGSPPGGHLIQQWQPPVRRSENMSSYCASDQSHTHYSSAVNAETHPRRYPVGRGWRPPPAACVSAKPAMRPVSINRVSINRTVTPALRRLCSNLGVEGFHWRLPSQANLKVLKPPLQRCSAPPAGVDSQIVTSVPSERVMTWRAVLEDRKEARGWTKGSFPVHLDLHLPQLGKLCPVTTFDPTSYWTKAGTAPVLFNGRLWSFDWC